ncbi:SMAD/FHA domain [Pseudocohnilembus persalinus]|uniref:ADP-ribosylhydrolase ARH1 n=1 Tax=Pseudocohnilembus persalinus TaxID=266149 RepID=A0A0V0R6Y4_PSEPJ|nr:SMAD/FHA domain [Pseudocohnilembus persalinus]|eukprot:KRX10219.1 SMAD/FHA domain [Pseudocohnilembus persalinus]
MIDQNLLILHVKDRKENEFEKITPIEKYNGIIEVPKTELFLGRENIFAGGDNLISRQHLKIQYNEKSQKYIFEDHSKNGLWVRKNNIQLETGIIFMMGNYQYTADQIETNQTNINLTLSIANNDIESEEQEQEIDIQFNNQQQNYNNYEFKYIGSNEKCHITIPDNLLSGCHAKIEKYQDKIYVVDQNSHTGIWLKVNPHNENQNIQYEIENEMELKLAYIKILKFKLYKYLNTQETDKINEFQNSLKNDFCYECDQKLKKSDANKNQKFQNFTIFCQICSQIVNSKLNNFYYCDCNPNEFVICHSCHNTPFQNAANLSVNENKKKIFQVKAQASIILSAMGDALGYKNGDWEFQKSGLIIHKQFNEITKNQGMKNFKISLSWKYSDDTIMSIATIEGLIEGIKQFYLKNQPTKEQIKSSSEGDSDKFFSINQQNLLEQLKNPQIKSQFINTIMQNMAIKYKQCWKQMSGRAPGKTTGKAIQVLNENGDNWYKIPFQDKAGGCGGSMRSSSIGICFQYPNYLDLLIAISIESGRLTHHHPTGYLGALTSALFTALAFSDVQIEYWPCILLNEVIPQAKEYIIKSGRELENNLKNFNFFQEQWEKYIKLRNLPQNKNIPKNEINLKFPKNYNQEILEKEHFIKSVSFRGWGGASGHDSVIIAYDALISSNQNWNQAILNGVLHGGDNDTTGTIMCAWYGAQNSFKNVYEINYQQLENKQKLSKLANNLQGFFQVFHDFQQI